MVFLHNLTLMLLLSTLHSFNPATTKQSSNDLTQHQAIKFFTDIHVHNTLTTQNKTSIMYLFNTKTSNHLTQNQALKFFNDINVHNTLNNPKQNTNYVPIQH